MELLPEEMAQVCTLVRPLSYSVGPSVKKWSKFEHKSDHSLTQGSPRKQACKPWRYASLKLCRPRDPLTEHCLVYTQVELLAYLKSQVRSKNRKVEAVIFSCLVKSNFVSKLCLFGCSEPDISGLYQAHCILTLL